MLSNKIKPVVDRLAEYITSVNRLSPLIWLYSMKKGQYYRTGLIYSGRNAQEGASEIVVIYNDVLQRSLYNDEIVQFGKKGFPNSIYYKPLTDDEILFILSEDSFQACDINDYIKGKYDIRFFTIDLRLNQEGTERLLFFQNVTSKYSAKVKRKLFVNPFSDQNPFKIIEPSREFMLRNNYDFIVYHNDEPTVESYALVRRIKPFETYLDIFEKYNNSFDELSLLPLFDFSQITPTMFFKRHCDKLKNFPGKEIVFAGVREELISLDDTDTKKAFNVKKIEFKVEGDIVTIAPTDGRKANWLMRFLCDGYVISKFLARKGVVDYIDVIPEESPTL